MQHSLHRILTFLLTIPMIIVVLILMFIFVLLLVMINCVMRALSSGLSEGRSHSWASTRSIAGTVGHSGDTPENALLCFLVYFAA